MTNQQVLFFETIKSSLPEYQNLAQSIAEVLNISINEAYKKIRGNSTLNLPQITSLCNHFQVSFTYQPNNLPNVTFDYMDLGQAPNMQAYLTNLLENLKAIKKRKDKHITITTDDIPLFHFFKYPELTCYKLFFWADNALDGATVFDMKLFSEEILATAKEMHQLYLEIPSTEIWSKDTVIGTLEQIRYGFDAGFIKDKALAVQIVEQLRYCLTDMNMYALSSKKTIDPTHTFNWYNCDVLGGICYLIDFGDDMKCYNRFNTFNYLSTNDKTYCQQTKTWATSLIRRSISFSGQGEKHRNKFLYNSFAECDNLIREINLA